MGRISSRGRNLILVIVVVTGIVIMSSCNNQVCPAYSKNEIKTTTKSV